MNRCNFLKYFINRKEQILELPASQKNSNKDFIYFRTRISCCLKSLLVLDSRMNRHLSIKHPDFPLTFCCEQFLHGGMPLESHRIKTLFLKIKLTCMKKIFTLLFVSLLSLSLLAFDGSRLSISSVATSTVISVEVDGRKFTMKDNSITLSYLSEGRHRVVIFREKSSNGFRKKREVVYNNFITLRRGFHLDITVNRFGKVLIDEQRINLNDDWYNDEDDYYNSDNDGWNNGYKNVMSTREFNDVKEQIRKEWFENNRLLSVKHIVDKSYFTTEQVKELMLLFTFESNRLEVAKYAYCKTVDQRNYFRVNDALTFSSTKEELARFLRESNK